MYTEILAILHVKHVREERPEMPFGTVGYTNAAGTYHLAKLCENAHVLSHSLEPKLTAVFPVLAIVLFTQRETILLRLPTQIT